MTDPTSASDSGVSADEGRGAEHGRAAGSASATDPAPAARPGGDGSPRRPGPSGAINPGPVLYKGEPLDAARGPGLGCFRFQLIVLVALVIITPLSVGRVPDLVAAALLFATIGLLLVSGQTIIFLLRLVAAERRGRREPLGSRTPTVGQLEDAAAHGSAAEGVSTTEEAVRPEPRVDLGAGPPPPGPVRQ